CAGDHDGIRAVERCFGIASDEGKGEDLEKIGVHECEFVLAEYFGTDDETGDAIGPDPRGGQHLRKVAFQCLGHRGHDVGLFYFTSLHDSPEEYADDPVRLFVVPVIAEFVCHIKHDDQTGRDAECQTGDIDDGKPFVTLKMT